MLMNIDWILYYEDNGLFIQVDFIAGNVAVDFFNGRYAEGGGK